MTLVNTTDNIISYGNIRYIVDLVHSAIDLIAMCFNFIIFLSFCWCKRPIKPALLFPMSLALADGIFMMSFLLDLGWKLPKCASLINTTYKHYGILIPMLHIVAIEFTLWYAVGFPTKYRFSMTGKTIGAMIFIAWFGPITLIVGYFGFQASAGKEIIHWDCKNYSVVGDQNWRIIVVTIFSAFLLVISLMGVHTMHLLKKCQEQETNPQFGRCQRYVIRTFHGLLISYLVGWAPHCVSYFMLCPDCHVSKETMMITSWVTRSLVILRALFSPFLYALRFRSIREAVMNMFIRCGQIENTCGQSTWTVEIEMKGLNDHH